MDLGMSSLAYINDCRINGTYRSASDILLEATKICLDFAENNDIKTCELLLDPPAVNDKEMRQKFIELCKSYNHIKKQVHGPYSDVNLASHNYWNREASINCYADVAKLCTEISAKTYTIHPGSIKYMQNANKLINHEFLLESTRILLDKINSLGLTTCIENMQKKTGILLDLEEITTFFRKMDRDDISFTWDTSHSWTCSVDVKELWKALHDRIKNIHVVDNFEKTSDVHPPLGSGNIDFNEIFEIIHQYRYEGSVIIEIGKGEDMQESVEFIRKFF